MTCPFPTPYDSMEMLFADSGIDIMEIYERAGSDANGTAASIEMTGDSIISKNRDTWGIETHRKRVNFVLRIWRNTTEDDFRLSISNFLNRIINWINDENAKRNTAAANPALPRFSMTEFEAMSADGGLRTAIMSDGRKEFTVQIHVDYEIEYE
jgi:hypothetical protein